VTSRQLKELTLSRQQLRQWLWRQCTNALNDQLPVQGGQFGEPDNGFFRETGCLHVIPGNEELVRR